MKKEANESMDLRAFERFLIEEEKSDATVKKYMHDVKCFLEYMSEKELTKQAVLNYKAELPEKYAVASANSMIAAVNSFFKFLGRGELCVKQFKVQREAFCPEEKELSRAEYSRLLAAARRKKNERLDLLIQTVCATGIRVSELQFITVEAVNVGEALVRCKGKSRRIFILPELKKRLAKYIKSRGIKSGAVFITSGGKPMSRSNIWREMKSLCADANVPASKVFPHNLRHLFARTFYSIEKDIAKLADILGHSSINTTRIYIVTSGYEHRRKMEHMHLII
ncbi:MAG: tyrosine-type recombinase/integrase [Clostridia bacterium]|nr:tyrosine-type recombinase/integrase [Clostridia bacterium]